MIAEDMPVQIRRCGTAIPVQCLAIGDLLYDPICDNYIEVIDILSRETARLAHKLARIRAGQFGKDAPHQDIILSRHQPVASLDRSPAPGPLRVGFRAAYRLGEEHLVKTRLFALFPERPGCICVAGALLQLVDPAALASAPVIERRRSR